MWNNWNRSIFHMHSSKLLFQFSYIIISCLFYSVSVCFYLLLMCTFYITRVYKLIYIYNAHGSLHAYNEIHAALWMWIVSCISCMLAYLSSSSLPLRALEHYRPFLAIPMPFNVYCIYAAKALINIVLAFANLIKSHILSRTGE